MSRDKKDTQTWRPPTRRAFIAMLGATAAAVAVREATPTEPVDSDPPRSPWSGTTRWIGHC